MSNAGHNQLISKIRFISLETLLKKLRILYQELILIEIENYLI